MVLSPGPDWKVWGLNYTWAVHTEEWAFLFSAVEPLVISNLLGDLHKLFLCCAWCTGCSRASPYNDVYPSAANTSHTFERESQQKIKQRMLSWKCMLSLLWVTTENDGFCAPLNHTWAPFSKKLAENTHYFSAMAAPVLLYHWNSGVLSTKVWETAQCLHEWGKAIGRPVALFPSVSIQ